jgi:hypothetical protein
MVNPIRRAQCRRFDRRILASCWFRIVNHMGRLDVRGALDRRPLREEGIKWA